MSPRCSQNKSIGVNEQILAADRDIVSLQLEFTCFDECLAKLDLNQRPAAVRFMSAQVRNALSEARIQVEQQLTAQGVPLPELPPRSFNAIPSEDMQEGAGI